MQETCYIRKKHCIFTCSSILILLDHYFDLRFMFNVLLSELSVVFPMYFKSLKDADDGLFYAMLCNLPKSVPVRIWKDMYDCRLLQICMFV